VSELKTFQDLYGSWADKTFPYSTKDTIASHFREESIEFAGGVVIDSVTGEPLHIAASHDPEEAADCLLLLIHHAHKNHYDLFEEAKKKGMICIGRTWDIEDDQGKGHFRHKEER